jgi:hypothetical protein
MSTKLTISIICIAALVFLLGSTCSNQSIFEFFELTMTSTDSITTKSSSSSLFSTESSDSSSPITTATTSSTDTSQDTVSNESSQSTSTSAAIPTEPLPTDASYACPLNPKTFSWTGDINADQYEYRVGSSEGTDDIAPVTEIFTTSFDLDLTSHVGTTLYWGVRQHDTTSNEWSDWTSWSVLVSFPTEPSTPIPANSDTFCGTASSVLSWDDMGVTDYHYRLATTFEGSDINTGLTGGTAHFIIDLTPYDSLLLYWGVRSQDADGCWSSWTAWEFTVTSTGPGMPTGPIPADGGTICGSIMASFTWDDMAMADYEYQIGTSLGGSDILGPTSTGGTASFTTDTFSYQGVMIYWSVRSLDGSGCWSSWADWHVNVTDPTEPTTPTPTNAGSVCETNALTLDWDGADGDLSFDYKVGTSVGGEEVVSETNETDSTATIDITGYLGATLYWSVRAEDTNGCWSDWVDWNFTVADPPIPTTPAPTDMGIVCGMVSSMFSWDDMGMLDYEYRLGTIASGNDLATGLTGGMQSFTTDLTVYEGLTLYWGVRSQDALGCWGAWSDWQFTVSDPTEPINPNPSDAGTTPPNASQSFNWDPVAGAMEYEYKLGTSPGMDDISAPILTGGSTSFVFDTTPYDTQTLYWSVRAQNGEGCWSNWVDWSVAITI